MATTNGKRGLRSDVGIIRAIRPSCQRLMASLARRAGMLCSGGAIAMRERPALAFGLLTVLLEVALATRQARLFSRRQTLSHRLRHGRRQFKAALDLPPLAIKLLANPIIQDYLRRTIIRAMSQNLGR